VKVMMVLIVLQALALLAVVIGPPAWSGCGVKPVKPVAPVGCRDLVAQCECDERGERCRWRWVCVR